MPRYGHSINEDGTTDMRRMDAEFDHEAEELPSPSSPDAPAGEEETTVVYQCTACEDRRSFKLPMIIARHFNAQHDDLREDDDSWREYVEEVEQ